MKSSGSHLYKETTTIVHDT